ncbi:SIS domain-containing protein [Knoellia subterranea]|uniref:Phosphosugar isomerase n=1 Tax=Knoellia subterranea KCTC 19937 TaxID=1385521 RepID=A0A0A0JLP5_9MICO|nr:SIS domain-containing protein [Knoellia subterranea]KGN36967.1 phosphosugar isomerase [Knoellia subterranea KCTC 19937]
MPHLDEAFLDSAEALESLDSRGSLRALATAGAQVRRAILASREAGIERVAGGDRPRSVLVASLGGSAVVCDVLDVLAEPGSPVPLTTRREAPLPGWIGPLDLVIAVSQSGRAAGPLALAAEAARRGASLLTVGTPDSPLADVSARGRGVHVDIAVDVPTSRAALWSMLTPVLLAADGLGLIDCSEAVLERVADRLDERAEECRPSSESFVNPAKILALGVAETVPVVLGDGALTGVAASRAAAMLARTARMPATHGALPDAASQVVACFDGPFSGSGAGAGRPGVVGAGERDIFADPFLDGPPAPQLGLLMLRDTPGATLDPVVAEGRRDAARLAEAVTESARDAGVRVWEVEAAEGHPIERLASLIAMTDYLATYLALALGLDPAVSPHVADLRDRTS